jgi:hypothetical protein
LLAAMLYPIIKRRPFRDWGLYFIGQLYLAFVEAIDVFQSPKVESWGNCVAQNMQLLRLSITKGITEVFGKMHRAHYG